jgi:polyphenol oxidase
VKLVEKEHCYLFDGLGASILAGFTKPELQGDPVRDISTALSFVTPSPCVAYLKQIHSAKTHFVDASGLFEGDGLYTSQKQLALVVKTADCLPVFLYSDALGIVGLVHMGWRGAKEGILDGIAKTLKLNDLSAFKAIAGVGMRSCCYKVGNDFRNVPQFKDLLTVRDGSLLFDPIGFARRALGLHGLKEEDFFDLKICSLCAQEKYFSHRRDKTSSRTLSFIIKT